MKDTCFLSILGLNSTERLISDIRYISAAWDHLQGSFPFCFCRRLSVASLLMLHIDLRSCASQTPSPCLCSSWTGLRFKGVSGNTVHSVVEAAGLTGLKSCGSLPPANVGSSLNRTTKLPLLWSGMKNKGRDLKFITITRGNRDPTVLLLDSSCCRRVMIHTFLSFAFVRWKFDMSLSEGRIWCFTLATHNSFSPF